MVVYVLVEGHIPRIYSQHALDFMGLKQKEKKSFVGRERWVDLG